MWMEMASKGFLTEILQGQIAPTSTLVVIKANGDNFSKRGGKIQPSKISQTSVGRMEPTVLQGDIGLRRASWDSDGYPGDVLIP
ncbi:MAG TPA: hypothetical protein DD706_15980 [Nitrospiraceae bacterium]|nr:hypothetical protein [Nitrospiraceae bacterium]